MIFSIRKHTIDGIGNIKAQGTAAPRYFTLSGVRGSRPVHGVYDKRSGGKNMKSVFR